MIISFWCETKIRASSSQNNIGYRFQSLSSKSALLTHSSRQFLFLVLFSFVLSSLLLHSRQGLFIPVKTELFFFSKKDDGMNAISSKKASNYFNGTYHLIRRLVTIGVLRHRMLGNALRNTLKVFVPRRKSFVRCDKNIIYIY